MDKETNIPFAVVIGVDRTADERRAVLNMAWKVIQKWNNFKRKSGDHDFEGIYLQMGKSNGHKWFKTGRKQGVKNFTLERALFRVHLKKVEELFPLAFLAFNICGIDKKGQKSINCQAFVDANSIVRHTINGINQNNHGGDAAVRRLVDAMLRSRL